MCDGGTWKIQSISVRSHENVNYEIQSSYDLYSPKSEKIYFSFSVVQSSSTAPREHPVRDREEQNLDPFCYICKYSQSGVHKENEIEIRIDVKQHSTTGAKLEGQLLHCDRVKEILFSSYDCWCFMRLFVFIFPMESAPWKSYNYWYTGGVEWSEAAWRR